MSIALGATVERKPILELEEFLSRLEKRHGNVKTLAARFRQEKFFSFMDKPLISQGFILFSSPDRIRFDVTEPFPTALLSDGKNVNRYEFVDGQWRLIEFGGGRTIKLVIDQIGQWMQGKFSGQKRLFVISVSTDDPNVYALLDLEPRPKEFRQYIQKIQIHISGPPEYSITRIDIHEPKGDRFALVFVREILNQELPKDCFSKPQTANQCQELFIQRQTETQEQTR
jgi:hypothetical protein